MYLRTYEGDIAVFYEIFWRKVYDVPQLDIASLRTIIDAGANIGMASLFFRSQAPNAKIFSIEPDADNFQLLQKNTIHDEQIICIHAAIDNEDGLVHLSKSQLAYNTKVAENFSGEKVTALSMASLMQRHNIYFIDLLKIDVEGFEHKIFSSNLQWLDHVHNVLIEIHSEHDYAV